MRTAEGRTEPWGAGPARKANPGQAKSRESIAQASVPGKTDASLKVGSRFASKMTWGGSQRTLSQKLV